MDKIKNVKTLNIKASNSELIIGELEHPNKMPFSGVLTYFDVPSDNPPNGSGGRRVVIPSSVGIDALPSLIGMAINYIPYTMDGHDPQEKIGIITEANVGERQEDGSLPVLISGYVYAMDFEDAAVSIKLNQAELGFSYETAKTILNDGIYEGETVAIVSQLVFTGASVLYKDTAAYTATSLAASKEEVKNVDFEKFLDELKQYIDQKFADFAKEDAKQDAETEKEEDANESKEDETETKADAEETEENNDEVNDDNVADESGDPTDEEENVAANDDETKSDTEDVEDTKDNGTVDETDKDAKSTKVSASAEFMTEFEAMKKELAELKASADLQASARKSATFPVTLMAKHDIKPVDDYSKLMAQIDSMDHLSPEERFALKMEARANKKTN